MYRSLNEILKRKLSPEHRPLDLRRIQASCSLEIRIKMRLGETVKNLRNK